MATYHLTAKIGKKGKAAAYIASEGKYSGYDRYEDLEVTARGNMPEWAAHNATHFWQAADEHERVNGSAYREIEVALPRELTHGQRLELVQEFIEQELGDKHAYQFAIHMPKAALEKNDQPHAHIMYSERIMDGIACDPEHYFKRHNATDLALTRLQWASKHPNSRQNDISLQTAADFFAARRAKGKFYNSSRRCLSLRGPVE